MPTQLNLDLKPPLPSGNREWPAFIHLTYGANAGLADDWSNDAAYPCGYVGWPLRMGHHMAALIGQDTGRTDAAVLAAALLMVL